MRWYQNVSLSHLELRLELEQRNLHFNAENKMISLHQQTEKK